MTAVQIPEDHIRTAAFYMWLEEGRPEGRDRDHWEAARDRLMADAAPKPKARRKTAGTRAAKPKAATAAKSPRSRSAKRAQPAEA